MAALSAGVQDEKHFPSEPSYKTCHLGDKVLLVLESAGGEDILEAVVYVLLLHVPGAPGVESSNVVQEPLRFEAGSWVQKVLIVLLWVQSWFICTYDFAFSKFLFYLN